MPLDSLPVEILEEIHLLSQSEHLPLVTRYTHAALSHPTPHRAALWLIAKYPHHGTLLPRALECPVCSLAVLNRIERLWPAHSSQPLTCPTLPKRIFRHPTGTSIPPLLPHLLTTYAASPNSHGGYPLSRASLHSNIPLITALRRAGADPAQRGFLAVQIGISRRDLDVIRVLVDGPGDENPPTGTGTSGKRKRKRGRENETETETQLAPPPPRSKIVPVRLPQHIVDTALTKGTPEIIHYIIQEKGYMPSLRSIVKLK